MIRYILSYTKSEMSSFFCGKFVFFVSFQHLVSAFFSSTTLCVAGVLSAPPLGDFRKSDRQCMLSPAHAPCGSMHSIEFAQQIHKFRGRVPRNLYKGRKNVPARRGFSSKFDRKRGFDREAARKTLVFRRPQNAPQFCGAFFCRHRKNTGFRVLSTV